MQCRRHQQCQKYVDGWGSALNSIRPLAGWSGSSITALLSFQHWGALPWEIQIGPNTHKNGPHTTAPLRLQKCEVVNSVTTAKCYKIYLIPDFRPHFWSSNLTIMQPCLSSVPCQLWTQQELSYRKQIARQLRSQCVEGIYRSKYYTVTLKSRLSVTQGHWKWNNWIDHTRLTINSYLMLNSIVTLKCGLEVTQGHWKWYHLKAWVWFPIRLP